MKQESNMYLRAEKLLPGDVMLFGSRGKAPTLIKKATDGNFSHAAIVIFMNEIFEATTSGLGYAILKVAKAEKPKFDMYDVESIAYPIRILCDISAYEDFAVYRHKDRIGTKQDTNIAEQIIKIASSLNGLEYPKLVNLANTSDYLSRHPALKNTILKVIGSVATGDNRKLAEGMFCSELVTYLLRQIGLEPFIDKTPPSHISPNHFARDNFSNMVLIDDLYADLNESLENDQENFIRYSSKTFYRPDPRTKVLLEQSIGQFIENYIKSINWILEKKLDN
ncbi:MAG: hypothetical protein ACKN9T_06260 [Candidatus Methylumidiphilus sp.]